MENTCKLCVGEYTQDEMYFSGSDNSCDIGPVCVFCMDVLGVNPPKVKMVPFS